MSAPANPTPAATAAPAATTASSVSAASPTAAPPAGAAPPAAAPPAAGAPAAAPAAPPPPPPAPAKPEEPFVLEHDHPRVARWDGVVFITILLSLVTMPMRIGFLLIDEWVYFIAFDTVMDLIVAADIVFTFFRTYEEDGEVVRDRKEIRMKYLKSNFVLDLISTLPIEYIGRAVDLEHPLWRVLRMFRLQRVYGFFMNWERISDLKPSIIGILKSIFIMLYCSHVSGCIFNLLLATENADTTATFLFSSTKDYLLKPFVSRYFRSLLWGLLTLTGFNQSIPVTQLQCLLQLFVSLFGIALFGVIIGNFGQLLVNLDSSKLYFQAKLDRASEFMEYKKLPKDLRWQVIDYYQYLWKSGKGLERNEVIDELPGNLKTKMAFFLNSQFIKKVPMFKDVIDDTAFMQEVVSALNPRIILPNSLVVKKGEMGTEMFFVARGELNVINDATGAVVFTLKSESFFGEIAILYDIKRTATIVARTYCDTFVLTKGSFKKVMKKFPSQSKGIKEIAKVRYQELMKKEEDAKRAAAEKLAAEQALAEQLQREQEEREQLEAVRQLQLGDAVAIVTDEGDGTVHEELTMQEVHPDETPQRAPSSSGSTQQPQETSPNSAAAAAAAMSRQRSPDQSGSPHAVAVPDEQNPTNPMPSQSSQPKQ